MMAALALATIASVCHLVDSGKILGRDLAAALPAFAGVPAEVEIGFAPIPGARRIFQVPDLARLASRYGVETGPLAPLCFERSLSPLVPAAIETAMRKELQVADADLRIEIIEFSLRPTPAGEVVFPRAGLGEPSARQDVAIWHGYLVSKEGRFPIWARVRIAMKIVQVVAAVNLKHGDLIGPEQVRLEEINAFPRLRHAASSLDVVVGRLARHQIAAGTPVMAQALDEPNAVQKGDSVEVEIHSGRMVLKLSGLAESAGRRGDVIAIRNLENGKVFRGRVRDKQQVIVDCSSTGILR